MSSIKTLAKSNKLTLGAVGLCGLCSCALTTTGGYLVSEGSSPAFEGLHATVAETLTPTLANNNCILKREGQVRVYTLQGRLVEVLSEAESESMSHEFIVANYCR